MRQDIIDALQKELVDRCGRESNQFGMGIYWHIEAVARNAAYLAREYGGDEEISTIAGWLHDLAAVTDPALYEEHHLHGAKMTACPACCTWFTSKRAWALRKARNGSKASSSEAMPSFRRAAGNCTGKNTSAQ